MNDVVTGGGFQPARRLVDLANALRADPELPREALAELLVRHGERPEDLAGDAFPAACAAELRSAVARMTAVLAETGTGPAARALNEILAECGARPRLTDHGGRHPWHLHVDRDEDAGWADWFLATSALALAQIVTEHGRAAWGECAAPGCSAFYLDAGPGSARRYCSATCASRARVAAHRRRRKKGDADNPAGRREGRDGAR
ncbi:CGNR zinc finger domain-containing protein [Streptomyces sp. HK10]|uniref:CGNR zinc finger domain-containing protein n=1 Tax=Streptomyces sp. HK10 TaxID=3373255 RepID=UPI003749535F